MRSICLASALPPAPPDSSPLRPPTNCSRTSSRRTPAFTSDVYNLITNLPKLPPDSAPPPARPHPPLPTTSASWQRGEVGFGRGLAGGEMGRWGNGALCRQADFNILRWISGEAVSEVVAAPRSATPTSIITISPCSLPPLLSAARSHSKQMPSDPLKLWWRAESREHRRLRGGKIFLGD